MDSVASYQQRILYMAQAHRFTQHYQQRILDMAQVHQSTQQLALRVQASQLQATQ